MRCAVAALSRKLLLGAWLLAAATAVQSCTIFDFSISGFAGRPVAPPLRKCAGPALACPQLHLCESTQALRWPVHPTEGAAVRAANVRHLYHVHSIFSENGTVFVDNHRFPYKCSDKGGWHGAPSHLSSLLAASGVTGASASRPCGWEGLAASVHSL